MITVEEYLNESGYAIQDLTQEELAEVKIEVDSVNQGFRILDGVLARKDKENGI